MAKETLYRCDKQGCNLTRPAISETNHWFLVELDKKHQYLLARPFYPIADNALPKIFCGEAHALEYISSEIRKLHPSRESGNVCVNHDEPLPSPKRVG